jgi:hypothetical protein
MGVELAPQIREEHELRVFRKEHRILIVHIFSKFTFYVVIF